MGEIRGSLSESEMSTIQRSERERGIGSLSVKKQIVVACCRWKAAEQRKKLEWGSRNEALSLVCCWKQARRKQG